MLIHQLKMGTEYSKFNEIQDYYSNAETLMEIVRNIYLENTKLDKELLNELLNKDLWLNSTFCRNVKSSRHSDIDKTNNTKKQTTQKNKQHKQKNKKQINKEK